MYYADEIDSLDNLPSKSEVKSLHNDDDWFYLIKKDGKRINLFMMVESISTKEFNDICLMLIKKLDQKPYLPS